MFRLIPSVRRAVLLTTVAAAGTVVVAAHAVATETQGLRDRIRARIEQRLQERTAGAKTGSGVERLVIAGRQVAVWRPAPTARGAGGSPVVLFSHGFGGCGTQSTFLTEALAGYLVMAPDHKDARCGDGSPSRPEVSFRAPEDWTEATYADRRDDMLALLDAVRTDPAPGADARRVGLVGHSLGGYTVLGLAGAWPSWRTDGIAAVVALSPYCQPYVAAGTLANVTAPAEYQGGTRDVGITPAVKRPDGCYAATPAPAAFVEFDGAGHLAWTDLQDGAQTSIVRYTLAFLDRHVRGARGAAVPPKAPDVSDRRVK